MTLLDENRGLSAIRSVDYIIILCDDLDNMKRFYTETFGFHVEENEEGHLIAFRVGTLFLCLRPRGRIYDGPTIPERSAAIQISFRVPPDDVDIAYETLKSKNVDVIEAPTNQDWTHRTLFVSDPENNIIEIFADIHARDAASISSGVHRVVTI